MKGILQAELFPSLERRGPHLLKDRFSLSHSAVGVLGVHVGQSVGGHFAGVAGHIGLVTVLGTRYLWRREKK
jgi:hypothetical protein